jgi:MFS family permease
MQDRNLRWNFGAALIDAAGWGLGMGLVSATTILPLFVGQLTESAVAVGMIQAVMYFGWLVPGILVAGAIERLPRVKASVMWIAAAERLMLLLAGLLCLWLGTADRNALLAAFFACWLVMNVGIGANTPGYYKLIAKTIPASLRGRLYGVGGAVSSFLGVGAALLAGWLLDRWGYPAGYAACFFAAFVAQSLSVAPIAFMREPAQDPDAAPPPLPMRRALRLVLEDRRLLWICAAVALFSLNQMAAAFYTHYARVRFGANVDAVIGFTIVLMAARVVAYLAVGWVGDHLGNRAAIRLSTVSGVGAAALAWAAPDLGWLYLVFALNEAAVQGWGICAMNYVLELCPPERSSTYTAVYSLFTGPFRVLLPLLGGVIGAAAGFGTVFALAVFGGAAALLVLLTRVTEPRHEPAPAASTAGSRELEPAEQTA